jgi:hypothetical protein
MYATHTLVFSRESSRRREIQLKRARAYKAAAAQQRAAGQWWRTALQRYKQQKMWMHLGPPNQGQLPSRFVRIHEVSKRLLIMYCFCHYCYHKTAQYTGSVVTLCYMIAHFSATSCCYKHAYMRSVRTTYYHCCYVHSTATIVTVYR